MNIFIYSEGNLLDNFLWNDQLSQLNLCHAQGNEMPFELALFPLEVPNGKKKKCKWKIHGIELGSFNQIK